MEIGTLAIIAGITGALFCNVIAISVVTDRSTTSGEDEMLELFGIDTADEVR